MGRNAGVSDLLDTHILLWWLAEPRRLSRSQTRAISKASAERPLLISEISLWEVASLVERGRIRLNRPLRDWLEEASAPPLVRRCGISPAVVAEMVALAGTLDWDPADRIIVATARVHGARVLTADRRMIESHLVATVD